MSENEPNIDLITDEISIIMGVDSDGTPCYATKFGKSGTEKEDGTVDLIDFVTGLGMLEAAKHDFLERHGGCNGQ